MERVEHFDRLFVLATVGAALLFVGAVNLGLGGRRGRWPALRALLSLAACAGAPVALAALTQDALALRAGGLLTGVLLAPALLGSGWVHRQLQSLGALLCRPAIRWGAVAVCGLAVGLGSVVWFEAADEMIIEEEAIDLEIALGRQPHRPTERAHAVTDRGTVVVLKEPEAPRAPETLVTPEEKFLRAVKLDTQIIRRAGPSDVSNCHGWVFTGGQFLLSGEDVELVLKENGYAEAHEPSPGDIVIYRMAGAVSHTALVRYVAEGQPVLAESKWGILGVFLHPTDKTPYGTDYTFYRSPRRGHLLVGVGGTRPDPTVPALPVGTAE